LKLKGKRSIKKLHLKRKDYDSQQRSELSICSTYTCAHIYADTNKLHTCTYAHVHVNMHCM